MVFLAVFQKGKEKKIREDFGLTKTTARFTLRATFVLTKDRTGLTMDIFVVKCTGRGLAVKRPGVLSKVQMLNLVLGVGVFSLLPTMLSLGEGIRGCSTPLRIPTG